MSKPPTFGDIWYLTQHISQHAMQIEEVKALHKLCSNVPPNGLVVEVGCQSGRSSSVFAQMGRVMGFHTVHIDPYTEQPETLQQWAEAMYFLGGEWTHAFNLLCMRTEQAEWWLSKIGPIDLAFIDGDHEAPSVETDLKLVAELVKPGGILACHDYVCQTWRGVKEAVDPYVASGKWEFQEQVSTLGIWRRL